MILYNVTVSLDVAVENAWLKWMREKHINDVLDTGCFIEARLSRVNGEEEGGVTYAITYFSPSVDLYNQYQDEHAPVLQQEHTELFAGKFAAFRTILNVIEEFKR
ncbi:DUF4286 family protein [Lishizhenia sp.]|uniref:DUF4286 family protein n=1 Tax=Lishizhenia sp. TaxID=2497594 RepID=UPI00299F3F2F|nr:DUF4286 family protein [Lishizhenia sp.]MDX1444711.1 DUF4286 family protein [Lishizhenia sp.]